MFSPAVARPHDVVEARVIVSQGAGLVVRFEGEKLILPTLADLAPHGLTLDTCDDYLGTLDGEHLFAATLAQPLPAPFVTRKLRSLYLAIDDGLFAAASRAVQVSAWLATHRFCGQCGRPTTRVATERAMQCTTCDLRFYPRIAPAIIVLVRRGAQALLARGTRFPMPMYSTLAGFSEVGESLEETLAREIKEEVGITVTNPRYFGSQSWPFPNSLMVGFFADYESGDLTLDSNEIVDAKWFDAHDLPLIPPGLSIARRLIDHWIADVTKTP